MIKKNNELVAEISLRTDPENLQTLPLFIDESIPNEYLVCIEGKYQTLNDLIEKYNIIITKA